MRKAKISKCGNEGNPPKREATAIYSGLAAAKEPATIACIWQDAKAGRGGRELLGEEGGGSGRALGEAVGMRKLEAPMGLLRGACITFSKWSRVTDRDKH